MSLFAIAAVIVLGILLLLIEFLVIPGISVAGIAGFLLIVFGLVASYYYHGSETGLYTLLITIAVSIVTIYYVFKQNTWKKVGLKSSIDSKHSPFDVTLIHPGDSGKTITRLAPVGKVMVNDIICEGKSLSGFMDENTEIEVTKVLTTQIIVKPKI
jgi:membrane-bound ClpP family serine protease